MTKDETFNLIDDPWIIALRRDGQQHQVSILELFDAAEQFTAIGGEVPTQGFAITRLLLAFLHRALDGPAGHDDWAELWEAKSLPMTAISAYAGKVRPRFNLFDPKTPFFQVAGLQACNSEVSGLERLVADVPNGERFFTTRSSADLQRISAAEGARWLVHVHAFDPSGIKSGAVGDPTVKNGKGYPIGPGWAGQLGGVLLRGSTLRQTLMLNLIGREARSYVQIGSKNDLPPWERSPDGAAGQQRPPHGAIDLYTWQTRRVRLVGDRTGVTGVVLANGDRIQPQNMHTMEPHSAWYHSGPQSKKLKTTVYMARTHDATRSVWRGLAALLPAISGRHGGGSEPKPFLMPGALQWVSDLAAQGVLPEDYKPSITVCGAVYGAQQATFAEIVDDEMALPVVLLRADNPAAGTTAVEAVRDAEHAAFELWKLAENLAQAAGAEQDSGAGDGARESLYAALDAPYRSWVSALTPDTDLEQARTQWRHHVLQATKSLAADLITAAPPAAWTGRERNDRLINVSLAETWFTAGLYRVLGDTATTPQHTDPEVATA